ncbi:hypothetical protein B0A49_10692 [Cryomyces minteri]|uniref:Uncharacterized protein n=1 Tax=Cryomyces minteri TaxID=331657 RepID=A0A4V5NE56_9PEZI|nr:hypothetical protein B0A49_10692 [Cryomyces minteri]
MGDIHDRNSRVASLPLNLMVLIVSYLDDVGDIARVTRTSRLLYYMTLPQLYEKVSLRSYEEMRYVNGRPEGYGSGSPFSMGLNGLVTKNVASFVRNFRIWGEWKETDLDELSKGRVPDTTMMLNIVVRAAVDKMVKLESFSWELSTKPLKTVYHGLALQTSLTSLAIKFPSSRVPRPTVVIPPMPNLRYFRAEGMDPLCYPDDISVLLAGSRKLEDLRLHWSPRMRKEAEPSLSLHTYFGKCFAAQYRIPLKHIALQNFYGPNNSEFDRIYDVKKLDSVTLINSLGGANGNPLTVYFDDTWNMTHPDLSLSVKMMRSDAIGRPHVDLISRSSGLEELYLIDPKNNLWSQSMSGTPATVEPSLATPSFTPKQSPDFETHLLGKDYLHAITSKQGSTMRHLLLSDQWSLSAENLSLLVRSCPNLSQLGLAVEKNNPHFLRLLIPFLPKLFALRLLNHRNTWSADTDIDLDAADDDAHICGIGRDSWQAGYRNLKWIGVGERVFELGNVYQMEGERGEMESRRQVRRVSLSAVKHVEIWKLDAMEI